MAGYQGFDSLDDMPTDTAAAWRAGAQVITTFDEWRVAVWVDRDAVAATALMADELLAQLPPHRVIGELNARWPELAHRGGYGAPTPLAPGMEQVTVIGGGGAHFLARLTQQDDDRWLVSGIVCVT